MLPLIILKQSLTMGIYMLIGFFLCRSGKVTKEGSSTIATMLLWLVIPAVIVDSFCVEFTLEKLADLGLSALIGALVLAVSLMMARLIFPRHPIDQFAAGFSNAGFIGIPLVRAALGEEAVFYLVGMVALLNILQWSYGTAVLTGERSSMSAKKILCNPIMVGVAAGLLLFVTGLGAKLPAVAASAIDGIAALNTPLAMITLGCYLSQTKILTLVTTARLYWLSIVRLVLIPGAVLLLLWVLPADPAIKHTIFVAAAAPVGANVAVYAQLHKLDYPYACQTVALSTVLSIAILPIMAMLAEILFV